MVLLGGKTNVEEAREVCEGRGYNRTGEVLLNSDITPAYTDLTLTVLQYDDVSSITNIIFIINNSRTFQFNWINSKGWLSDLWKPLSTHYCVS